MPSALSIPALKLGFPRKPDKLNLDTPVEGRCDNPCRGDNACHERLEDGPCAPP
jgi:hypothetical protein